MMLFPLPLGATPGYPVHIQRREVVKMNERFTRIQVPLGRDEYAALLSAAMSDYRHPRDQARAILRAALLGGQEPNVIDLVPEKHNDAVLNFGETHGAVAAMAG